MPALNKFNTFSYDLARGAHNLSADVLKVMLTATLPVAANAVYSDVSTAEVVAGNGYTTGGLQAVITSLLQSGGVTTLKLQAVKWTATGPIGPFQYAILYNATTASPLKPLIGWYDYGSQITMASGDTFTESFNASGELTVT